MTYAYNVEADLEGFTEADLEVLEFVPEDIEGLEADLTESMSLENIDPEEIAESLESFPGYSYGSASRPNNYRDVNMQLLKTFTAVVKRMMQKISRNPRTRSKLQTAVRQGPTAVNKLVMPSVSRQLTPPFRFLAYYYVPRVTRALAGPIRKEVGVKPEEVEEVLEWDGAL